VNRIVRGHGEDVTAEEALRGFERFPSWMWRNTDVLDLVGWLREHNDRFGGHESARTGFYGLDLYSLYRSIQELKGRRPVRRRHPHRRDPRPRTPRANRGLESWRTTGNLSVRGMTGHFEESYV
jgi:hypothetical protein